MPFSKTNFVDNQTVIDAATLNAIQDELIRVAGLLGKDIQSAAINDSGHLILTLTDGTTLDAGVAKGAQGEKGATGPAGPRGPAGAPGKDGAGMDITGATVGQIAKIAAVDSNGAPTAWSPVDIPSGGGEELRLIRTINVSSDDLNSIYFNVDDENRPFNLHRVVFAMYGAPTNTGSKQATLFFRGGDKNLGADHEQATYGVQVNSGAYNYVFGFIFEIYNVGGLWFGDSAYGNRQVSKVDRYVPSSKSTDASISEIKLLWNALDVYFPNGSTIEVWGA